MKNSITQKQLFALLTSFFLGNSLALAGGLIKGEKIGYITIFASFILYIGLCFLYEGIFRKNKSGNLFEITKNLTGNFLYRIFLIIMFLYSFFTAVVSSVEFMFFLELSSDFQISPLLSSILFSLCILSVLLCKKRALARYSQLTVPFVIAILLISLIFGIEKMNISNLKIDELPSLSFISNSILTSFLSPFSHLLLVYLFISDMVSYKKITKTSIVSGLFATLIIFSVYISNLLILGKKLMGSLYFPTLYTLSVINPNLFTQRSESVFFVVYIFFDVLYTALAYFVSYSCFSKLIKSNKKNTFPKKYEKIFYFSSAICSFIVMNLKIDIKGFFESFLGITYIIGTLTVFVPVFLFVASIFKKPQIKLDSFIET